MYQHFYEHLHKPAEATVDPVSAARHSLNVTIEDLAEPWNSLAETVFHAVIPSFSHTIVVLSLTLFILGMVAFIVYLDTRNLERRLPPALRNEIEEIRANHQRELERIQKELEQKQIEVDQKQREIERLREQKQKETELRRACEVVSKWLKILFSKKREEIKNLRRQFERQAQAFFEEKQAQIQDLEEHYQKEAEQLQREMEEFQEHLYQGFENLRRQYQGQTEALRAEKRPEIEDLQNYYQQKLEEKQREIEDLQLYYQQKLEEKQREIEKANRKSKSLQKQRKELMSRTGITIPQHGVDFSHQHTWPRDHTPGSSPQSSTQFKPGTGPSSPNGEIFFTPREYPDQVDPRTLPESSVPEYPRLPSSRPGSGNSRGGTTRDMIPPSPPPIPQPRPWFYRFRVWPFY